MSDWLELAHRCVAADEACALITVTRTAGSTPREVGARMLITRAGDTGTIGGGRLELAASARARAMLAAGEAAAIETYNLGAGLGQCCGGRVELLIQRFDPSARALLTELLALRARAERHACLTALSRDRVQRMIVTRGACACDAFDAGVVALAQRLLREERGCLAPRWLEAQRVWFDPPAARGLPLTLFGAGHVGRALVHVIAPLAWPITWVETRDGAFPEAVPSGVTTVATEVPEACIDDAPTGSAFVIMTHDHALDYRLCERALTRSDAAFCGLIGSRTKRAKFMHRLGARGFSAEAIARITCPIGLAPSSGKAPFEVAISAAAQLLQVHAAHGARVPSETAARPRAAHHEELR